MYRLLTFVMLSYAFFGEVTAQQSFNIDEAIAYAMEHANDIKLDQLNITDADAQIDEYLALGIPKIDGNISYQYAIEIPTQILPDFISPSVYNVLFDEGVLPRRDVSFGGGIPAQFGVPHTLDLGVQLQTLLLDGSYFVGLRAQKLYKELVQRQHRTVKYDVKAKVIESYLTVLNLNKNIRLLDNNILNLEKILNETRAVYESGFAEKLDVDRLDLSLKNLIVEKNNLTRLTDISLLALKFNMGLPLNEELRLSESFDALADAAMLQGPKDIPNIDFQNRTEIKSLETALQLQDINIKRYRYSYLPSLTGFINYGQTLQRNELFDNDDNGWFPRSVAGVNLAVPIFDGFDKRAKIQRAKISKENTLLQKSIFEQGITLNVNRHYLSYINAKEKVISTKETLDLANDIYEITKIKFREGVGSSIEVTQAEGEWYRAQTNYNTAQFELITTYNNLQTELGNN